MNMFWLKIAGIAVAVVVMIILINALSSRPEPQPKAPEKTFWDQVEEDDKRLRAEPQLKQPSTAITPAPTDTNQAAEQTGTVEPPKPQFRELSEIENIDAEQLFNNAIQFRKIGRLPGPSYKIMVDTCRQIIQKYPGSEWAWKAKRMLADIPEHYRARYKITEEEIDLGNFK